MKYITNIEYIYINTQFSLLITYQKEIISSYKMTDSPIQPRFTRHLSCDTSIHKLNKQSKLIITIEPPSERKNVDENTAVHEPVVTNSGRIEEVDESIPEITKSGTPRRPTLFNIRSGGGELELNVNELIDAHLTEVKIRADGHSEETSRFSKRDRRIGCPTIILTAFASSVYLLATDVFNKGRIGGYIAFALSILSFILGTVREYYNWSSVSHSHDLSAKLYMSLFRSIELRLIEEQLTPEERRHIFKEILDQMSIIEQYEPKISSRIMKQVQEELISINTLQETNV